MAGVTIVFLQAKRAEGLKPFSAHYLSVREERS